MKLFFDCVTGNLIGEWSDELGLHSRNITDMVPAALAASMTTFGGATEKTLADENRKYESKVEIDREIGRLQAAKVKLG